MPNITGQFYAEAASLSASGAFYIGSNNYRGTTSGQSNNQLNFDASRSSSVYQNVTEVRPDNFSINYFIKY